MKHVAQAQAAGDFASPNGTLVAAVGRSTRLVAIFEWVLVGLSYFMLFFELHWVASDGGERFDALTQLLESHTLPTTRYSMVGPIFSAPLWYLGKVLLKDPRAACGYYNWVVLGVFAFLLARLLKGVLEPATTRCFLLLLFAGSMFANHVQAFYAEVFTAACVATGVLAVCAKRRSSLGWTAIVLGSANTPAVGLGTAAICLFFSLDRRRFRYLLPILAVGGVIAFETLVRRHGKTGYEGVHQNTTLMPYSGLPGFSYPFLLGLLGLIMSFGKGILYFAPGVFTPVKDLLAGNEVLLKTQRAWLCFLVGLILVYAKFCGWYGGEFWGPRYVMFASVPASFALALNLRSRKSILRSSIVLTMLTLSVWVCADGVVFRNEQLGKCWENGYALEHLCWYVPEFSVWIRPFIVHRPLEKLDYFFLTTYFVIYVVLATPTVIYLAKSVASACKPRVQRLLEWRTWGF